MQTKLGLTGGIGSGKSTVAAMLVREGAALIDADAISRKLTVAGGAAIPAIAKEFGPQYIGHDGSLDRDRMRAAVFACASTRSRLESILHPLVQREADHQAEAALAGGQRCLVFDIPLLVESRRWRGHLEQILVVDCETETQIARTIARSQLERPAIERIIASQATRLQRLQAADLVIFNDSNLNLDGLSHEVGLIARRFGL